MVISLSQVTVISLQCTLLPPKQATVPTGSPLPLTGMPMAEIKTLVSMRNTAKLEPGPTLQNHTTSGTTQTTTSMGLKPGARTVMSMALPHMAKLPLRTITVLVDMVVTAATDSMEATEAIGLRQLPLLLHTVRLRLATTTTSGPSSLTDRTTTQDGANPTTLSTQSPMIMRITSLT